MASRGLWVTRRVPWLPFPGRRFKVLAPLGAVVLPTTRRVWRGRNPDGLSPWHLWGALRDSAVIFRSNPAALVLVSLSWTILSLPIVTLLPATLGVLSLLDRLEAGRRIGPLQAIREVIRGGYRFFWRGIVLQTAYMTILVLPLSSYQYYRHIDGFFSRYLFWAELTGMLLFFVSQIHTLPLLATRRVSLGRAMQISWRLFLGSPAYSLVTALLVWGLVYRIVFTTWWLLPFVSGIMALFISRSTLRLVEEGERQEEDEGATEIPIGARRSPDTSTI
ncbi:MAG: hypothetical protein M1299_12230 [Firmicutes bacterium]|nr:hypothetical protein [Bacillota bacterium]MCL5040564.1 hypothetical protein [Bacillota bacterium]